MLKSYLKIAFRFLKRHKAYAFINISGFAVGMASCLLIFMLIKHEWSYDRFHENADHIYRTSIAYQTPDGETRYQNMMFPDFTPQLEQEFPAIHSATRYVQGSQDLKVDNEIFRQDLVEVDTPFFEMFTFPLLSGDSKTALADPSGMVLTETVAKRFFDVDAASYDQILGRQISITRDEVEYTFAVTGIAADLPTNSSFQFDAAISFENYDDIRLGGNNWGGRTSTYVLLNEGEDASNLETALIPFVETQFSDYIQQLKDNNYLVDRADAFKMSLQPLPAMHQTPEVFVPYEVTPHDPLYSYILGGIGLLILLIACINFMTLSVGLSASRAREVGMRKVLGAQRNQLMQQYWGEALIQTSFGLVIGFALSILLLPFFNELTGQTLSLFNLNLFEVLGALLILLIVVGLVAGGYPSVLLSRFQPVAVLKGIVRTQGKDLLNRSLVVLQYTISIALIIGTLIMAQQLNYLLEKDLGYDKELVMVVNTSQVSRADAEGVLNQFRNTLLPYVQIDEISRTGSSFTRGSDRNSWQDADGITRSAYNFGIGIEYVDLMGMEIVEGRNFLKEFPTDSTNSILVNEALVREFGIEDPVGKQLTGWLSFIYDESPTIIGVVKDYHFRSLREEVVPAVMNMHPNYYNYMGAMLVKISTDNISSAVSLVENTWADVLPGKPFTYSFLDEDVATQYQTEERWSGIVTSSALLAILIASLGLFGLATLTVSQRTREIGIRKVLGASMPKVVLLISSDFVKLVGIAAVIAWPLAYFGMTKWLSDFASKIDISIWPFAIAALLAIGIAMLTISSRAIGAAMINPVKALRYRN
ncbi:MAG: ABC transporter permease [Rhodothermales bacterium]